MRKLLLGLLLIAVSSPIFAQPTKLTWRKLATITFEEYFDESREVWALEAIYPDDILALNGQEIYITGYVLPLDPKGNLYALSAFPFSSCFFCGGAGPESVMGLEFAESPGHIPTDAVRTFKGRIILKAKPGEDFYFTLVDVEPYTPSS